MEKQKLVYTTPELFLHLFKDSLISVTKWSFDPLHMTSEGEQVNFKVNNFELSFQL